jgi:hypothetical protein
MSYMSARFHLECGSKLKLIMFSKIINMSIDISKIQTNQNNY